MNDRFRRQERTSVISFATTDSKASTVASDQAHLIVIRGQPMTLGRVLSLGPGAPTTIGRGRDCSLTLADPQVSSHHARIAAQRGGGFVLTDLDSTNGTRVNGQRVSGSWSLRDGEKLTVGETLLLYSEAGERELGYLREPLTQMGSDLLTGLEAKRRFDESLDSALASARMMKAPLALMMLDIDGLRSITLRHGPAAGSECIRVVGGVIKANIGADGHGTRYGGDDFSIFIKHKDRTGATEVAERIRAAVEGLSLPESGTTLNPTVSIGVAAFPEDGDWVLDLLAVADRALYRAKSTGKNRVTTR